MGNGRITTMASRHYDSAHAAHYARKDLHEALGLYQGVMDAYPDTQEADYSRTQISNIVKSVVPDHEVLTAETELTLAHLGPDGSSVNEAAPLTALASELLS